MHVMRARDESGFLAAGVGCAGYTNGAHGFALVDRSLVIREPT